MISSALAPIAIRHYRFIPGIGVPLIVTVIGIFSKKLARGKRWEKSHFYSGTEMTLAAMAAALLNLGDLIKPDATPPGKPDDTCGVERRGRVDYAGLPALCRVASSGLGVEDQRTAKAQFLLADFSI